MAMGSSILRQYAMADQNTFESWPDDAVLYQPLEAEQILLAENASCLAVKTYLKMCQLPFTVRPVPNAEFMSPGGRMTKLPFIKVGAFIHAEFEPIVNFIKQKGHGIGMNLEEDVMFDIHSYVSLVENIFNNAELYVTFMDKEVYETVTKPRIACAFPWPLNVIQIMKKRQHVLKLLRVYQWKDTSISDVVEKVQKCCETLTAKLEENGGMFFYSDEPTELDAIVFGHLYTILSTALPNDTLARAVNQFGKLVDFCNQIEDVYFRSPNTREH